MAARGGRRIDIHEAAQRGWRGRSESAGEQFIVVHTDAAGLENHIGLRRTRKNIVHALNSRRINHDLGPVGLVRYRGGFGGRTHPVRKR